MDQVSSVVIAVNNPIMDGIATTIHNDVLFVFLLAILVLATERNRPKLKKIIIAAIFVAIITLVIKNMLRVERPCLNERFLLLCAGSYSFPSVHTAIAFAVATAFLQKRTYPIYALFALLVAFTRIYIGVHSFFDITGGLAIGVIGYYLVDLVMEKQALQKIEPAKERDRQYFHILLGLVLLMFLLAGGKSLFLLVTSIAIFLGSFLANFYFFGYIKEIDFFKDRLERKGVKIMGFGSALYLLGLLLLASFLQDTNEIAGGILLFALSDGASTLFGLNGKHRLVWNNKKTAEGLLAFFIAGLPSYIFIGFLAIPLSAICAIVESLPFSVDDNILVPTIMIIFFLVV